MTVCLRDLHPLMHRIELLKSAKLTFVLITKTNRIMKIVKSGTFRVRLSTEKTTHCNSLALREKAPTNENMICFLVAAFCTKKKRFLVCPILHVYWRFESYTSKRSNFCFFSELGSFDFFFDFTRGSPLYFGLI